MPRVRVRRARPSEAGIAASLLEAAFVEFTELYTPAALAATTPGAGEIRRRMAQGPTWLAFLRDDPVGTVSAFSTAKGLYIRSMAVHPRARGHGAGVALLKAAERFGRARKRSIAFLRTTPFLGAAIALYRRAGYTVRPDVTGDLHGTPLLEMEKRLSVGAAVAGARKRIVFVRAASSPLSAEPRASRPSASGTEARGAGPRPRRTPRSSS